jgi:ribosomal protein L32
MTTKRTRLENLGVGKIDLVGAGDNPRAHVALYKAAPMVKCPECGKQMPKGGKCPECGYMAKAAPTRKADGQPPTCGELLDAREASDELQKLHYAFTESMYGILYGGGADKVALLKANVEVFGERLKEIVGEVEGVEAMKSIAVDTAEEFVERAGAMSVNAITKAREIMKDLKLDVTAIPEAQRPAVVALQKSATDAAAALTAAQTEVETLKAENATLKAAAPKPADVDDLAGLTPVAKERILAERALFKATTDEVAKLRDEREQDKRVAKVREDHADILGTSHEAFGGLLYRIEKGKATPADAVEVERLVKSLVEQARSGNVVETVGSESSDSAGAGDPFVVLDKRAKEMVAKKEATSYDKACDHILATDEDLRKRMSARQPGN